MRYIGPKLWNLLPKTISDLPTLSVFKQRILQLDLNSLLTFSAQIALYVVCNHYYFYEAHTYFFDLEIIHMQ